MLTQLTGTSYDDRVAPWHTKRGKERGRERAVEKKRKNASRARRESERAEREQESKTKRTSVAIFRRRKKECDWKQSFVLKFPLFVRSRYLAPFIVLMFGALGFGMKITIKSY